MRFLIDDERRFLPDKTVPDMIATTFLAGEIVLGLATDKDEVYIDHDLGDEDPKKTGYQLLTNYESFIAMRRQRGAYIRVPHKIVCVSSNPPGRTRINAVIASIHRLVEHAEPAKKIPNQKSRLAKERSPAPWRGGGGD